MRVGLCYEVNGGVFFSPRMELRRAFPAGNLKTSVWISFQPKSSCSLRERGKGEGEGERERKEREERGRRGKG